MKIRKYFLLIASLMLLVPILAGDAEEQAKKINAAKVEAVKAAYEKELAKSGFSPQDLEVYSIGKSHIDLAWKWRVEQTRDEKCPATFRNAIQHSLEYPGFTFSQSSGQYYEWIQQGDPALFADIKKAEKDGRWFLVGGMWDEPDGNIPEGESFARQFLYGQRFFLENFGHITDVGYMEDSFGYNWNLPQFSARSGIKYMYTAKPTWNMHNIFPFHIFQWQGPDGSRVLTYISSGVYLNQTIPFEEIELYPRDDYFLADLDRVVVNGRPVKPKYRQTRYLLQPGEKLTANYLTTPEQIKARLSSEMIPVLATYYGTGDGGHGPLVIEIETHLALDELGYAKSSDSDTFFKALEKYSDRIATWDDEMYLERHQGVTTSHEWIKRMNRQSESLMRTAEAAAATASLLGAEYPREKLTGAWKLILLNQFHDILPGSGIAEVYQDSAVDYEKVEKDGKEVLDSSLAVIAEKIDTSAAPEGWVSTGQGLTPLVLYNPLGFTRNDTVRYEIPADAKYRVFELSGKEIVSQVATTEEGKAALYFSPGDIPGLGWKTVLLKSGEACALSGPKVKDGPDKIEIESDLVSIALDKKSGLLVSLFDKRVNREFLKSASNRIMAFKDKTYNSPAWDIAENYLSKPIAVPEPAAVKIDAQGPLFVRVLVERRGQPTRFKQWITVFAGSPLVGLVTWTDNPWPDSIIKLEYNTVIQTDKIAAEIPYGVIERSTHPTVPWDAARTEMACEKWIDLSDSQSGIALINFGKYGFSKNEDGAGFRMSIVKNAVYTTAAPEAYHVKWSTKLIPDPQTDPGEHWAHLALLPHAGTWRDGQVSKAAYEFNTPVAARGTDAHHGPLPAEAGLISMEGGSAYIAALKRAEDDNSLVLRVVEESGKDTEATIKLHPNFKIEAASETDLLELNPKPISSEPHSLTLPVGHNEIKTIKVKVGE